MVAEAKLSWENFPTCSLFSRLLSAFKSEKANVCVEQHKNVSLLCSSNINCYFKLFLPTGSSQVICGNISRALKSRRKVCELIFLFECRINKLTSVFHVSILLLIMNFVITLSK